MTRHNYKYSAYFVSFFSFLPRFCELRINQTVRTSQIYFTVICSSFKFWHKKKKNRRKTKAKQIKTVQELEDYSAKEEQQQYRTHKSRILLLWIIIMIISYYHYYYYYYYYYYCYYYYYYYYYYYHHYWHLLLTFRLITASKFSSIYFICFYITSQFLVHQWWSSAY